MLEKLRKIKNTGLFISVLCASIVISSPINQGSSITSRQESGRMKFYLTRISRSDSRTLGVLTLRATSPSLMTLEPPLRPGKPRSIPAGTYVVKVLRQNGQQQPRLLLQSVAGFSNVYIEVGNFPKDTRGCILVGLSLEAGELRESRKAYQLLLEVVGASNDFLLSISDVPQASNRLKNPIRNDIPPPLRFLPIHP